MKRNKNPSALTPGVSTINPTSMNYNEIKRNLREAGRLVDAGQVAAADALIRSMVGKGMTGNDLDVHLSKEQMRKLRAHSKKRKNPMPSLKKKNPKTQYRTKNVSEGDPNYHLRNIALPEEVNETLQGWTGGQGSMTYSLMSTAMNDYVSPSMIDAAVTELEYDLGKLKKKNDKESRKLRKELEELIGELDVIARFSNEYASDEVDSGYATWLMKKEENPSSKKLKSKLLR